MATLESGNPLKRASTYWHCYTERIQWKNLSKKILTLVFSLGFWEGRGGILTWIFSSVCMRPAEARKIFNKDRELNFTCSFG